MCTLTTPTLLTDQREKSIQFLFVNINIVMNTFTTCNDVGVDSVVSVVTCYRLDSPGIKSWWGWDFCTCPDWPWDPPSLPYNGYRVSFPGIKRPGCGIDHSLLSSTSGRSIPLLICASTACSRVNFIFYL